MSLIKSNAVQIGQSGTATQNFTLAVPSSPDGTIKLARGNSGATTQDVMNVSNAGVVSFPQGLGNISSGTAIATGSTTARSLANRFADVFNVKDFGAVGDGVADDRIAIQAAVDAAFAAGGGTVYLPAGTYLLASFSSSYYTVKPKSNVSVVGSGPATIVKMANGLVSATQGYTFLYDHTNFIENITISDFTMDWNGQNNPNQNTPVGNTTRMGGNGGVSNVHIRNVIFKNPSGHHNIWIAGSGGGENSITNCIFQNAGRAVAGNTLITDHSSIYENTNNTIISGNIFFCTNLNDTVATAIEIHGQNINVTNNIVYGYSKAMNIAASDGLTSCYNIIVSDNNFNDVNVGITLWSGLSLSLAGILIDSNIIELREIAGQVACGIQGNGSTMNSSVPASDIQILNNSIKINGSINLSLQSKSIDLWDWSSIYIENNILSNFSGEAIYIFAETLACNKVYILNNDIENCGITSLSANKRHIVLLTTIGFQYVDISNNFLLASAVTGTIPSWGVQLTGTYTFVTLKDNSILGFSINPILKSTTESGNVCLIKHAGAESPYNLVKATQGSEWRSTSSSRVWSASRATANGNSNVWISVEYGTTVPTTQLHSIGDIAINESPVVGAPKGWTCTVTGTPGTWVSQGNL